MLLLALVFTDDVFEAVKTPLELFSKKASNKQILHLRWKYSVLSQCDTWVREYGGGGRDAVESGSIVLFTVE